METPHYKAIIVDDEEDAREIIALLLHDYYPGIEVAAKIDTVASAVRLIPQHEPDIVFLDIEMGDSTGFDLLHCLPGFNGLVVFITAYNQYAIKAIKASAADYLLKPLTREEFTDAVNKVVEKLEQRKAQLTQAPPGVRKIGIPSLTGYDFVDVDSIMRCEADGNYSALYFTKAPKVLVSKPLSYFENDLRKYGFMRIHHKHLVNLNQVINYSKGKSGGYITMSDGAQLEVSVRKKPLLLKALAQGG
jgi:two-component system LytT family response regulator